jgi:hypothetical protein
MVFTFLNLKKGVKKSMGLSAQSERALDRLQDGCLCSQRLEPKLLQRRYSNVSETEKNVQPNKCIYEE